MRKRALIGGFLSALISAVPHLPAVAADEAKPSATLEVASEQMRLIMGGTSGKGVLHFNGQDYPFTFKSASAGLGAKMVEKMSATGVVYSLTKIEDFAGEYTSIATSAMAGSSEATATYTNSKGVSIHLKGTVKGVGLSLGGGLATVKLAKK